MVIIGVDPHKRIHVASALEPGTHRVLDSLEVQASLAGYRLVLRWAGKYESRRWAVENARGLGRHLAQWLLARGETVDDVPSTATARVRELSRGGRRKTDVIDAAAAASVAALAGDGNAVYAEDVTSALALLDERRTNPVGERTRAINQSHALLRELVAGAARTDLSAAVASRLPTSVRPAGPVETVHKRLARDLVTTVRDLDARLKKITAQISTMLGEYDTTPTDLDGVGPVVAGRLLGRTGRASRFTSASAFASYAGVAPVQIASAAQSRHRLPRGGDRQLNLAPHYTALTQVRMRSSTGRAYYDRKTAEGKTHNEAMRCLKRRLADRMWPTMNTDERRKAQAAGPGGHSGAALSSRAAGSTPDTSSSDKSLPGPASSQPTTSHPAA